MQYQTESLFWNGANFRPVHKIFFSHIHSTKLKATGAFPLLQFHILWPVSSLSIKILLIKIHQHQQKPWVPLGPGFQIVMISKVCDVIDNHGVSLLFIFTVTSSVGHVINDLQRMKILHSDNTEKVRLRETLSSEALAYIKNSGSPTWAGDLENKEWERELDR